MSGISGPKIITSGCVLSLDAADKLSYKGSGTTWKDLSGNNNNGTLTNGPTFSGANSGCIVFDGIDDYVGFTYNSIFNPPSNISVSLWVKLTVNNASIRTLIELSVSTDELYFIYWRGDLSPKRWWYGLRQSNNTYVETNSTSTDFSINTWYNLALVADSSTGLFSFYINGILDNSIAYNGTLKQTASSLSIGADAGASRRYLIGNISNTLIYNRALSATEILNNYNATKSRFNR
jgi:hypothetical protein